MAPVLGCPAKHKKGMFETVVPEAVGAKRSRRLLYETLPLSLALHALMAAGAVGATIWNVEFPGQSPKQYTAYSLAESPPPPPPPPPPPAPKPAATQPVVKPIALKLPLMAPAFIPDEIPVVREVEEAPVPVQEVPSTDTAGQTGGTEGGIEGGEVGGQIGGALGGIKAQPLPDLVKIERDLPLPMATVAQEFPAYPEFAKSRGWEDTLVVRYVIDKRGKVKEVTVVTPPQREEFSRAAIDAIRHWRFQPFKDENGEPKEVVHELTVEFKIVRSRRR